MKVAEARTMDPEKLDEEVIRLKKEQFNLRFQRATGQLENTSRVRVVRRDIARLKTVARQKRAGVPMPAAPVADAADKPKRTRRAKAPVKQTKAKSKSKAKSKAKAKR